jgi:hypothetical protein
MAGSLHSVLAQVITAGAGALRRSAGSEFAQKCRFRICVEAPVPTLRRSAGSDFAAKRRFRLCGETTFRRNTGFKHPARPSTCLSQSSRDIVALRCGLSPRCAGGGCVGDDMRIAFSPIWRYGRLSRRRVSVPSCIQLRTLRMLLHTRWPGLPHAAPSELARSPIYRPKRAALHIRAATARGKKTVEITNFGETGN